MADLTEEATWEAGIYQLELTDPVEAGPGGIDNLQAQQLANRTAYLKALADLFAAISVDVMPAAAVELRGSVRLLRGAAGVADSVQVCAKRGDDTYDWITLF